MLPVFCLKHKHLRFRLIIAVVVASVALLDPGMRFIADMRYRLEIACEEFQQTKAERDGCSSSSPSCRSLNQRLEDAWLGTVQQVRHCSATPSLRLRWSVGREGRIQRR